MCWITKFNYVSGEEECLSKTMGIFEVLSICALLCSSDVIAAIAMISYSDQPKLFSIVYGEGVFNDIVSIILFNTVQGYQGVTFEFGASTVFSIAGEFIILGLVSILIGLAGGVISSLMFKWCRFLCHSAITETLLLLIVAMLCYFISETMEKSSIISLLTCGICMAHYTWYNLSPQGKTISSITISIFGSAAESFVFAYIGLCTFTYTRWEEGEVAPTEPSAYPWSVTFIVVMCVIIIVGRIVAVWTAHGLVSMCSKSPDVTFKELLFITYGGMIRGAIAFGLVLKIPDVAVGEPNHFKERGVVVTTTLACVIFTTVVFGSFMPIVQKLLVAPAAPEIDADLREQLVDKHNGDQSSPGTASFEGDERNKELGDSSVNES